MSNNAKRVLFRKGTTADHQLFTGARGEVTVDITRNIAIVHNGITTGGHELVGVAATGQSIVNKDAIGIGTPVADSALTVEGDVRVSGIVTANSLDAVNILVGILTGTNNNTISLSTSIIPNENETYDLGSLTNRFRDLYLSGNTLKLGDASLSASSETLSLSGVGLGVSHLNSESINVTGISTFQSDLNIVGDLDVDGHTELDDVNVSGVSTASSLNVTGTSLFQGNVDLNDNIQLRLGTGNDLQLYHESNNSYINNIVGNLYIRDNGGSIFIQPQSGENSAVFNGNTSVELYYNGNKRFETTDDGVDIIGTGSIKIPVGTTTERSSSPTAGQFRFNSTEQIFEGYITEWLPIGGSGINTDAQNNHYGTDSNAANFDGTATDNVLFGHQAGFSITSGDKNVVIGSLAGNSLNSGNNHVIIGYDAGGETTGTGDVAIGYEALKSNTGDYNTALGYQSGGSSGSDYGVYLGYRTGGGVTGDHNIAVGFQAIGGNQTTSGNSNICMGVNSGNSITSGSYNLNFGAYSGLFNTDGQENICIGFRAGQTVTNGDYNIFLGAYAGYNFESTSSRNIAIGRSSATGVTGSDNTIIGNLEYPSGTVMNGQVAIGAGATELMRINSNGVFANYFNTTPNDVTSGVTKVCVETGNDGYIRHGDAGSIRSFINVENGATADQTASEILTAIKTVDGSGSGLDADLLDGAQPSVSASNSTIVQRHSSGYIYANYFNTTPNDVSSGVTKVLVETGNDGFMRHGDAAAIQSFVNCKTNSTTDTNQVYIRNTSPTVYFRDTDHNSGMVHCNSNLLYVLRGANDSTAWTQVNSQWPFIFNLSNNNATCGNNFDAVGDVTAYSSDRRLKENFKYIDSPLEKVLNLNGYTFDWKDTVKELGFSPKIEKNDVGLIAQEVQEVIPQAVAPAPFDQEWDRDAEKNISKSGEDYLTVKYEKLVPLLVEAIKEQQQQIDELRRKLEEK